MSENRVTEIVEKELPETEELELLNTEVAELDEQREEFRDELFEQLKIALVDEQRLLKRFYDFCGQYDSFEYDEMGLNMDEAKEVLRKTNKIRDKFLNSIEEKLLYVFENVETNTLTNIISFDLDAKEFKFKVVLEVFTDSFNLEIQ